MFLGPTLDASDSRTTAGLILVSAQEYKAFATFFSEHCKRRMTSRSNALGGSSGASLLEALHWEHPPLKQRVGEVSGFRTQHENLRGVLQTVLSDDDRSAVAEVTEMVVLIWAECFFLCRDTAVRRRRTTYCAVGACFRMLPLSMCDASAVLLRHCVAACICALDPRLFASF